MTLQEIELVLGPDAVRKVREAVQDAFVASLSARDGRGPIALENLVIAMLVTVTVTPANHATSESRVAECMRRLEILARATRELYLVGGTPSDQIN